MEQLDPQVVNLAKAIRQAESGGNFNARSKDGSYGAYQFIKPTWDNTARKYGVNAKWEEATPAQQNEVAYKQLKEWKDKGHNVGEIASMWNAGAGRPNAYKENLVGVNSAGVKYDTPGYAKKVATYYQQFKGQTQQTPNEPAIDPVVQQKQELISQGQPVALDPNRVEPTVGGNFVRGLLKTPASLATNLVNAGEVLLGKKDNFSQPFTGGYLGEVQPIGQQGLHNNNILSQIPDTLGSAAEIGSYAIGGGAAGKAVVGQTFKQGLKKALPTLAGEGAASAGLGSFGTSLREGNSVGKIATDTLKGAGIGAVAGPVLGGGLALTGLAGRQLAKKTGLLQKTQGELDNVIKKNIDNVYSGVTGDADQISNLKSKAQKGLELYTKENKTINTKNPNELISSINKFGEKISTLARSATEKASKTGFTLDTTDAKDLVLNAYKNGELPGATAKRLYRQIDSLGNDPLKIHDWVQDVNVKYGKKYQRGTIDDTALGKIADDVAENFRKQLDFIVDRKGYAEAYGNNQELKRMLVAAAKKANKDNKNVNFGDITTEAGLDAGISLLTGNPLYMVRTIGSGLLKGVFSKLRNTSGLRSIKKASSAMSKMETKTRLPSGEIKPANILKQSKETQMFTPKSRPVNQNLSPNIQGNPNIQNASTKIDSKIIIPKVSPKSKETSIGKSPVETIDLPRDLYEQGIVLDLQRQEFANNPLKSLIKYMNKRTNELPEITAKGKGIFKNKGDDIISRDSFGFRDKNGNVDSEKVREAFSEFLPKYRQYKKDIANYAKEVKGYIKTATQQKEYDKAINGFLDSADEYNKINQTIDEYLKQPVKEKKPSLLQTIRDDIKNNGQRGSAEMFKNEGNLTTKILKDLEGKTTVSKQYILDATNRGELKQAERDITRQVLDTMKGDTINVKEFADRVKSELLPLKRNDDLSASAMGGYKYENITLPDELRGNVENYSENIYESPIKTSAGNVHYSGDTKNYFGHTRIEDMADNKTRRVIEVQSDLYQKGNLEKELATPNAVTGKDIPEEVLKKQYPKRYAQVQESKKLQQYNDPTAHFRMVREEIKKAAEDGKTKLQFPTGETAMKIEGLGGTGNTDWMVHYGDGTGNTRLGVLSDSDMRMKVGHEIYRHGPQDAWIITDVLGDGKFKAVPKDKIIEYQGVRFHWRNLPEKAKSLLDRASEEFDISGKVDTNNPIYKFYEKDVQKYLNKFGGKRVVDDKGVSWIEIPITKEQGKAPVEAFGKAQIGTVGQVAGVTAVGVLALAAKKAEAKSTFKENKNKVEVHQIKKSIDKIYSQSEKLAPMIDKNYIKTLINQESTNGTNELNRNLDQGKYGWLVGFTKPTYNEIVEKSKKMDKYKNLLASMDSFDTPEGAIKNALMYSQFLLRDHTKEQTTDKREWKKISAKELYKLYNGNASPNGVAEFGNNFNSIKN